MKRQMDLLPRMAGTNIRKNGSTYLPYIGISVFAMFTYFVFDLILKNDIMYTLPKGGYALVLVEIGFALLGIIMVPFLYYTNSFLIKRRKRELGLYSILGLEKKHIGIMMFWESLIIYGIVLAAAIALGLLFSRLIFLLLLNLAKMPVNVKFTVSPAAILDTMAFYAFITGLNLFVNLIQVGKTNPVELMGDARSGEKTPRFTWLWSGLGLLALGGGYYTAVSAQLNSMIFLDFFLAIFLVVIGTYFLFTSGSIMFLKGMKKRKRLYYRSDNFITVSGMLYRMKKNAASLSNICIFATMVIITVVCSVAVYLGMDSIIGRQYVRNVQATFIGQEPVDRQALEEQVAALTAQYGVEPENYLSYARIKLTAHLNGEQFSVKIEQKEDYENWFTLKLLTLEEYNRAEGVAESLEPGEILIYSTGKDFDSDRVFFEEKEFIVKKELESSTLDFPKMDVDTFERTYIIVAADESDLREIAGSLETDADDSWVYVCGFDLPLESQAADGFSEAFEEYASGLNGFAGCQDYRQRMLDSESMYGSLLFIGIFFGLIFLICLLIIMYYKQITEGFEDQKNFEIMQKVGLNDDEIRRTIRKQIRMVFLLPLAGALCHTAVAIRMILLLLGAIRFYEKNLLYLCALVTSCAFAVFYGLCYKRTSGTYYRIVKQM
ncbi:MAG: FtsX-like permease family protein [Lachnospiraceae bacterium]|nr:FtsX-like permease family protein [Lachnospiraceae bacterium]MCM1240608.1 FtsX-like permease family protein [Lachnospiraceae bacterium]